MEAAAGVRYRRRMALLSGLIRTVAITGRTDTINAWFGGRRAEQTISAAFPKAALRAGLVD